MLPHKGTSWPDLELVDGHGEMEGRSFQIYRLSDARPGTPTNCLVALEVSNTV
jgi:hypothetical protein